MIEYDINDSPFFLANQKYCQLLETNFKTRNIEYTGDCNSFGYEVKALYTCGAHNYNLKCYKYQYTRNGVIIPVNAAEYIGIDITATGFSKNSEIKYGKSWLQRLLMNKAVKEKLQRPFYLESNIHLSDYQLDQIIRYLKYYKVIKFNLYKGKLEVKIFSAFTNPAKITADLEDQFSYLL